MLKKPFVDALILLGIAVNIGFLLINLSPERPHLTRERTLKILLRASAPRIEWMKQNEFEEYGHLHDLQFEFISAKSFEEAFKILEAERDKPTGIALADIDDEHAGEVHDGKMVRPIADAAQPDELKTALSRYIPESVKRGQIDGKQWFLPKRALVQVAAYLRPAVEDVYLHWHEDRPAIEAALKEANGVGLPERWYFHRSPDFWDTYDLFVAGWYWSHHPADWAERAAVVTRNHGPPAIQAPRIGYPCGDNEDANDEFLNALYRHGMTDKELPRLDHPAVLDSLQWRALFRKHGLVLSKCEGEGLGTFETNSLFHERKLGWMPIDQADSLWLHGGSRRDAAPGMPLASDLSWALLPAGASLELNAKGEPARMGRSFAFNEFHLWAVPVHSPDPREAWLLARFLTARGLQQRETEAEGMLPIRIDLRQDYPIAFRLDWMQRLLDASFRQLEQGSGDTPFEWAANDLDETYARLRKAVVYERPVDAKVSTAAVREALQAAIAREKQHGK